MIDKDVILAKVNNIQNCLERIHSMTQGNASALLEDLTTQDVVVLNLQRAVQAVIDLAAHIVASEKMGLPDSQKSLFSILQREGVLSQTLSQAMQKMVGFRNIAVHDYSAIDPFILEKIINHHLHELEEFYTVVIKRYHTNA